MHEDLNPEVARAGSMSKFTDRHRQSPSFFFQKVRRLSHTLPIDDDGNPGMVLRVQTQSIGNLASIAQR